MKILPGGSKGGATFLVTCRVRYEKRVHLISAHISLTLENFGMHVLILFFILHLLVYSSFVLTILLFVLLLVIHVVCLVFDL